MESKTQQIRQLRQQKKELMAGKKWQEALDVLDQLLEVQSIDKYHCERGLVLLKLKRPQEALASFEKALALNPESEKARQGIAKANDKITKWLPTIEKDTPVEEESSPGDFIATLAKGAKYGAVLLVLLCIVELVLALWLYQEYATTAEKQEKEQLAIEQLATDDIQDLLAKSQQKQQEYSELLVQAQQQSQQLRQEQKKLELALASSNENEADKIQRLQSKILVSSIDALKSTDQRIKVSAMVELGKLGERAATAVPLLLQTIPEDRRQDVQIAAIQALGDIGPHSAPAVPLLTKAVKKGKGEIKVHAAIALGKIGEPATSAIPALLKAIEKWESRSRKHADNAIVAIASSKIIEKLANVLQQNQDKYVKLCMSRALAKFGKAAIPSLVTALQSKDHYTKLYAIKALVKMETEASEAIPHLESLLQNAQSQKEDYARELASELVNALQVIRRD